MTSVLSHVLPFEPNSSNIFFSLTYPARSPSLARCLLLLGIVVVASASSLSSHLCPQHPWVLSASRYQKELPRSYFVISPISPSDPNEGRSRAKFTHNFHSWRFAESAHHQYLSLWACTEAFNQDFGITRNINLQLNTINLNFTEVETDCD